MPNLSETYKGWKESGMSGRGNTDALLHAIVEELLKHQPKEEAPRQSFIKEDLPSTGTTIRETVDKPKKK